MLIFITLWLLSGLAVVGYACYTSEEEEITIGDLCYAVLVIIMGGVSLLALFLIKAEKIKFFNKVIWRIK